MFLAPKLGDSNLILKNISNLPTIILKRFKELFFGKFNITVNEDIPITKTHESNKELSEFKTISELSVVVYLELILNFLRVIFQDFNSINVW